MYIIGCIIEEGFQPRSQHYLSTETRTGTETQRLPWVRGWKVLY